MEFKTKAQSISNHLDKYYDQLLKDGSMISNFQTLSKKLGMEPTKLSNYKMAIKEELERELKESQEFKGLDPSDKQEILSNLDQLYQGFIIPPFSVTEEECLDVMTVNMGSETIHTSVQKQSKGIVNVGTALGAVVGLGIGLFIQRSFPVLFISGVGGAALGSVIGKGTGQKSSYGKNVVATASPRPQKRFGKVSTPKLESIIQKRKALIKELFGQYCQQLEAACQQPILK